MANILPFMRPGAAPGPQSNPFTQSLPPQVPNAQPQLGNPPGGSPGNPPFTAQPGSGPFAAQPVSPQPPIQGPVNVKPVRYDYVGEEPSDVDVFEHSDTIDESVNLAGFRRQYYDYTMIKYDEMNEGRDALAFYDGTQWTSDELRKLADRGQPDVVFNRIDKKIDQLVGQMQRLRGDPKCFGRNAPDDGGAEVATQCIRYCLDLSNWVAVEAEALLKGMCLGYVVSELVMVPGDKGDPDLEVACVDQTTFYYDPRSLRLDFSDARYMGVAKLFTRDEFEEFWPDLWDHSIGSLESIGYTVYDTDKSYLWAQGKTKIRVVEHWYRSRGQWRYCYYAGDTVLESGLSPFYDEKGQTVSRYQAFAVKIDAAGDHYGYIRTLKGPQRAVNQHRSKSIWIMNTRQVIMRRGAIGGDEENDIEDIRREIARPDGVVIWDGPAENKPEFASADQEFLKQSQYYQDAKQEIDNFGPSSAAMMASMTQNPDVNGRILDMQQRTGLAEMGQFLTQWRNWRRRIYNLIWVQQQRHWTAERVLRVTNDQGLAQYVTVNALRTDQWNRPVTVNNLGQIDVDIIADEGPDTANVMGSVYDMLVVMAQQRINIPPEMLIETSALPASKKRELIGMLNQPNPQAQAAQQTLLANKQADTAKKQSEVGKNQADAMQARAGAIHRLAMSHHEVQKAQATERGTAVDTYDMAHTHDMDLMDKMLTAAAQGPPTATGMPQGGAPPQGQPNAPSPVSPTGMPGMGPGPGAAPAGPMPQLGAAPPPPPAMPAAPAQPPVDLASAGPPRPVPGGPPVRAPDGHFYVHAPHAGGLYQRVVR